MRQTSYQRLYIGRFHHFKKLVGGIVLQPSDGSRSIEESDTLLLTEGNNLLQLKALGLLIHKVVAIAKEHFALDAPVVVDEVGIIEVHAPSLTLWRKAAQKQHFGTHGQKGTQRMILHLICAAQDVFRVEIRIHGLKGTK